MNLEPSIRNGRILNLNDILVSLKKCTDADYLTDYIDEIESYVSDYPDAVSQDDINTLKSALKERLKTLKVPPLIGYYEFADLYKKLLEKTQTKEEEASVQRYIAKCLKLLEKDQISFDELVQIERSLVVNLNFIKRMDKTSVITLNDEIPH